jgi:hypothetical protein
MHDIIRHVVGTTDMLAYALTKALPEAKHTMIFKRCMGAAPMEGLHFSHYSQ